MSCDASLDLVKSGQVGERVISSTNLNNNVHHIALDKKIAVTTRFMNVSLETQLVQELRDFPIRRRKVVRKQTRNVQRKYTPTYSIYTHK